jgi:adenylate cyclase
VESVDPEVEALWRYVLTDPDGPLKRSRLFKHVPGDPRCKMCKIPLAGIATPLLKLTKKGPSPGNPRFCNSCELFAKEHPGGAELELSLLFADVRGSTRLAEEVGAAEFARLMQRFYRVSNEVLIDSDAYIDKPVGDEVIATYLPLFAGDHAAKAIRAAQDLLIATGHADPDGPWLPVGAGVHTGPVYMGTVGVEGTDELNITVLGDAVNVTARLASSAPAGELLVSEAAYTASGLDLNGAERRTLQLEGRSAPLDVRVVRPVPAPA